MRLAGSRRREGGAPARFEAGGFERPGADRPPSERRSFDAPREGPSPYGRSIPERRTPFARDRDRDRRAGEGRPPIERRGGERFLSDRRPGRGREPQRFQRPAPGGRSFDRDAAGEGSRSPLGAEASPQVDAFAAAAPSDLIWGRHSALATLEGGRPIHRVWCTPEMRFSPRFLQLLRDAKASGVLVEEVTWARLGQITGGAVHQGIVLQPAAADTLDLPTLIEGCRGIGEPPLLIAVDGLTDPQNLGAIVRSAEALGAHGLVLPQRRNAGLTGSVAKVAAGALEHLPVARVVNLNRSLDALKQEGYRVIGLAEQGSVSLEEADLEGPLVLVTGSEGDGLSMLTRRSCDQLVRIPLRGATPSLNASVATALLLYEVARRGWMRGLRGSDPAPRLVRPLLATQPLSPAPLEEGPQDLLEEAVAIDALASEPELGPEPEPMPETSPEPSPEPLVAEQGEAVVEMVAGPTSAPEEQEPEVPSGDLPAALAAVGQGEGGMPRFESDICL
jgi:23S rRNA (guanosine2251-2'-O)-methyltransferase